MEAHGNEHTPKDRDLIRAELSRPGLRDLREQVGIVLLPIGSNERHGLNLAMCRRREPRGGCADIRSRAKVGHDSLDFISSSDEGDPDGQRSNIGLACGDTVGFIPPIEPSGNEHAGARSEADDAAAVAAKADDVIPT